MLTYRSKIVRISAKRKFSRNIYYSYTLAHNIDFKGESGLFQAMLVQVLFKCNCSVKGSDAQKTSRRNGRV